LWAKTFGREVSVELNSFIGSLGTVTAGEAGKALQNALQAAAREVFLRVLAAEVEDLCGPAYRAEEGVRCRRGGNAKGFFYDGPRREAIIRPRVRRRHADGKESEESLRSYAIGQQADGLQSSLLAALRAGVSSRDQKGLHANARGTSSAAVSRLWVQESGRIFVEFRERDLCRPDWLVLILDGIVLGHDLVAIAAMGVRATGEKMMLDFEIGASENETVANALLTRLKARGFSPAVHSLLAILDGSKALKNAVGKHYPEAVIQRCLVHKERNLRSYLSRKHHRELARLFMRLRKAQGEAAGIAALGEITDFLKTKNRQAQQCLEEAGDELIAIHRLDVPATLNIALLSTNSIENSIRNVRSKTRRVTRWRAETDQPDRWLAYALLTAERGFRRIRGYADLAMLREALDRKSGEREKDETTDLVPIMASARIDGEAAMT